VVETVAAKSHNPSMGQSLGSDETKQLTAFSRFLITDQEAAGRVRACKRPQEIVAVASELGFEISVEILSKFARDLQANHWPWSGESGRWRIFYLSQEEN
jgi:hypothetical protein